MITQQRSLARQLIRRVVILSLIAILGITSAVIAGISATLFAARSTVIETADNAISDIELFMNAIQNDLEATGDSLDKVPSEDVSAVLREALDRKPAIFEVSLVDLNGNVQVQRRRVGTAEEETAV